MKFCEKCGIQLLDEAVMCPKCGIFFEKNSGKTSNSKILQILAKVFMVLNTVLWLVISAFFIVAAITLNDSALYGSLFGSNLNVVLISRIYFIGSIIALLPIFWSIPMIAHYFKAIKQKKPVGMAFKVCTLMFVSMIAGILMICDSSEKC